jgi:hypothetical protein
MLGRVVFGAGSHGVPLGRLPGRSLASTIGGQDEETPASAPGRDGHFCSGGPTQRDVGRSKGSEKWPTFSKPLMQWKPVSPAGPTTHSLWLYIDIRHRICARNFKDFPRLCDQFLVSGCAFFLCSEVFGGAVSGLENSFPGRKRGSAKETGSNFD